MTLVFAAFTVILAAPYSIMTRDLLRHLGL